MQRLLLPLSFACTFAHLVALHTPRSDTLRCGSLGMAAAPPPSPPTPTIVDNRFAGRKRPGELSGSKYGHDPRDALEVSDYAPDVEFTRGLTVGAVSVLSTVNEFQAALDSASCTAVVVVRFVRDGCTACASTKKLFEATAKDYGEKGLFCVSPLPR